MFSRVDRKDSKYRYVLSFLLLLFSFLLLVFLIWYALVYAGGHLPGNEPLGGPCRRHKKDGGTIGLVLVCARFDIVVSVGPAGIFTQSDGCPILSPPTHPGWVDIVMVR